MSSIEDRVSKLEQEVFGKKVREKNWRSTADSNDDGSDVIHLYIDICGHQ